MRRLLFASLALVAGICAAAGPSAATVHQVTITEFAFDPPDLNVAVGDSVMWVNQGAMAHTSTSGELCVADGNWDSGTLNSGDIYIWPAVANGDYEYYCTFHCTVMRGIVHVETGTATESTTWGTIRAVYR